MWENHDLAQMFIGSLWLCAGVRWGVEGTDSGQGQGVGEKGDQGGRRLLH